jgi:hypothetical protein
VPLIVTKFRESWAAFRLGSKLLALRLMKKFPFQWKSAVGGFSTTRRYTKHAEGLRRERSSVCKRFILFAFYVTKRKRVMKAYFASVMECRMYDIHVRV